MNRSPLVVSLALLLATVCLAQDHPLPKPVQPPLPTGDTPRPTGTTTGGNVTGNTSAGATHAAPAANAGTDIALQFADDQTIALARVDLAGLDLDAIQKWVLDAADRLRKTDQEQSRARANIEQELTRDFKWIDQFRSAGASRIDTVFSLSNFSKDQSPLMVIPLAANADPQTVEKQLPGANAGPNRDELITDRVPGAVLFGSRASVQAAKNARPQPAEALRQALASADAGQIQVVLSPTRELCQTLEQAVTDLPPELGGGPIVPVSQGIGWATLSISFPPHPSMRIVIHAKDAASAKQLLTIAQKGISWAGERKTGPRELLAYTRLLSQLTPKLQGQDVIAELSGEQVQQLAVTTAANLLIARNTASRATVASNLRQIGVGVLQYADANQGKLPANLGTPIEKYLGGNAKAVWTDPLRPNQAKPYVYVKLADKLDEVADPSTSVLVFENHTTWDDGINVLFADGHVEWVPKENDFRKRLDQTKKQNPRAVEMPQ